MKTASEMPQQCTSFVNGLPLVQLLELVSRLDSHVSRFIRKFERNVCHLSCAHYKNKLSVYFFYKFVNSKNVGYLLMVVRTFLHTYDLMSTYFDNISRGGDASTAFRIRQTLERINACKGFADMTKRDMIELKNTYCGFEEIIRTSLEESVSYLSVPSLLALEKEVDALISELCNNVSRIITENLSLVRHKNVDADFVFQLHSSLVSQHLSDLSSASLLPPQVVTDMINSWPEELITPTEQQLLVTKKIKI